MDFGEILSKAWKIIWKFKILWIFGILTSCGQGGGSSGSGGGSNSGVRFSNGEIDLPPAMRDFFYGIEQFFNNIQSWQIALFVLSAILLSLLLAALFAALNTVGRVGLIQGTVKADGGAEGLAFRELFESGKPFFWRVFGFNLLAGLAIFVLILLLMLPVIGLGILTLGIVLICLVPFICLLVPIGWLIGVILEQANIAIVVEDLNILDGFKRGWEVFRENIGTMVVMGLILGIGGAVVGFIMALPFLIIVVPAAIGVAGGLASGSDVMFGSGLIIAGLCFVGYLPVLIVLSGILQAYIKSAWTLTYLQLTGKAGVEAVAEELMPEEDL
jgi:hypothetical protein